MISNKNRINNSKCYKYKVSMIRSPLLSLARSKVFSREDSEDIVQNTLNIIIKKQSEYDGNRNFYGWAFSILRWQIMAYLTEKKRNREDRDYTEGSFANSLHYHEIKTPFDSLLKKELHEEQMKIIHEIKDKLMPPREKEFFEYQLKGWSKSDIVYAMKLSKDSQFYTYKRRVIQRLKNNSKQDK